MLLTATVTKWQGSKYSGGRVTSKDNNTRQFILNTSYMYDIKSNGTGSKFYFADRRLDRREKGAYLEITQSVDDIRTAGDTVVEKMITLPFYRNNNPNRATFDVKINLESLIYVDRYNADPTGASWVMIEESAFKIRPGLALVALSAEEILTLTSGLRDYDGNGYTTVVIGTQEWTIENLRVKTYSDGTAIPNLTTPATWIPDTDGAYCYYDNDETTFDFSGILYNWYAIDNAHGLAYFERDAIFEAGWRIPTYADWVTLGIFAGGYPAAGGRLKEIGTVHWNSPNLATDDYGFKCISGGNRYIDVLLGNGFSNQGVFGDHWTSTENPLDTDTAFGFYAENDVVELFISGAPKFSGQNVRCVRDI